MAKSALAGETQAFQMKGSLVPVSVLYLLDPTLESLAPQLSRHIEAAQGFFQNSPVIVDISLLPQSSARINFERFAQILKGHSLVPVALRGGGEVERRSALAAGLGLLNEVPPGAPSATKRSNDTTPGPTPNTIPAPTQTAAPTQVVDQVVRSGQQIYARNADLVVLSGVSPGAEVLADGNIHIYGPLRGRAVAGATGDTEARIFCASLEAELVSIAGSYQLSEDMPTRLNRKRVAVRLLGEDLHYDLLE